MKRGCLPKTKLKKNKQTKGGRKTQPAPHNQKRHTNRSVHSKHRPMFVSIFRTTKLPPYNLTSTDRSGVASARPDKNCKKLGVVFYNIAHSFATPSFNTQQTFIAPSFPHSFSCNLKPIGWPRSGPSLWTSGRSAILICSS